MLLKLLLLIGIVFVIYTIFFKKRPLSSHSDDSSQEDAMIPCSKCNTFVSPKEALMKEGKYYCSHECMKG
ncbi:PP0621 family protein [Sulfuricurvum sp.]|uniref:PP0621 family protein n=1 Tax=Sulfuricurvum sp. TaxID=2025608 RepID=UPI0019B98A7C|nr:PP0621 family protein [Sulfuricurvum sp.]MBD3799684.1 hypothetical protein [Campylobacterota bacterium]MBD3806822.1 hypothetical protein [Sulfuricurvum sp.]